MKRKHLNPLKEKGKKEALSEESLQNIAGGAIGKVEGQGRLDMLQAKRAVRLSARDAASTADIKAQIASAEKADIRVKEPLADFGAVKKAR
ncbi:hypothetical protein Lgra_1631 [Legionella gratiana]|uniref:Uncharacterized protein n=1 Tax=Legionella gratiana TaxID=45066 RepID=A0A378J788_9GAMM|nr:hypothetical protein [Legionella gratiana]KTD10665.1 hypothetical protein Lgra_1631 [Legionella gratiana]STX43653.1 Uncharacterised protein [Legionella gratiana]